MFHNIFDLYKEAIAIFSSVSRIKILAIAILTLISFQKIFTNFFCMILILVAENAIFYMYVHRDNFFFFHRLFKMQDRASSNPIVYE